MKVPIRLILAALTATLALSCLRMEEPRYPKAGDRLPEFEVCDNNGEKVSTSMLSKGKTLLVFFNTGCADCRKELPIIEDFHRDNPTVRALAISREESAESIAAYWKSNGFSIPFSAQETRFIYNLFSNTGIPLLVLSSEGTVIKVFNQYLDESMPSKEILDEFFQ